MSDPGIRPPDVSLASLPKASKASIIVEVTELDGPSPRSNQRQSFLPDTTSLDLTNENYNKPRRFSLVETDSDRDSPKHEFRRHSGGRLAHRKRKSTRSDPQTFRRKVTSMQLPLTQGLNAFNFNDISSNQHDQGKNSDDEPDLGLDRTCSRRSQASPPFGASPLLTPPDEKDAFFAGNAWQNLSLASTGAAGCLSDHAIAHAPTTVSDSSNGYVSQPGITLTTHSGSSRNIQIALPASGSMDQGHIGPESWLGRAIHRAVSGLSETIGTVDYAQMVAQILPVRVVRSAISSKPIFELVLEAIQRRIGNPQFSVNITHAVPHMIAMDDVPTSPPATPQFLHGGNDYFDLQTVFSLAGVVPLYHTASSQTSRPHSRTSTPIIARRSVDVSVLERYIPPVSTAEVRDFLTDSGRSYLVDRLAEVKSRGGTMLVVYPTKRGAETFIHHYLDPVLEPLMRQFIFFHSLFPYLGATLGKMEAVTTMPDFEGLTARISSLCAQLSSRPLEQGGPQSSFSLVYSDVGEIVLERSDWLEFWSHQEQPRIKADLVQYQREGGRMPAPMGLHEATPATLARELSDAMSKSHEPSGGVGIEVGVFVIQRSI